MADNLVLPKTPPQASPVQQGFKRVIIWATSGWLDEATDNYAFKFMTGISNAGTPPMPQAAVDSLPAVHRVNWAGMKLGFWWGHSATVPFAADWNGTPTGGEQLNPDNPTHVAKANAELDKALENGAKIIGLDAFGFDEPGTHVKWATMLKARAPGAYFVTEQMMPDYLHVLFPTYIIESTAVGASPALLQVPYYLANYLCPGHELFLQANTPPVGTTQQQRAAQICSLGYSPLSEYALPAAAASSLRALGRWSEIGEAPVALFSYGRAACGSWRDRNFRDRLAVR